MEDEALMTHHWTQCNLVEHSCLVCQKSIDNSAESYRCSWCDKSVISRKPFNDTKVHPECLEGGKVSECFLGKYRRLIVPPTAVRKVEKETGEHHFQVTRLED